MVILHRDSCPADEVLSLVEPFLVPQQQRRCVPVDDSWLASVGAYNKISLQAWFYRLFQGWEYILIFQLDAWIFRNDLSAWLDKGYTYVGAPWVRELGGDAPDTGVGNGGLSLRHVQSFLRILDSPLNRYLPVSRWRTLAWRICLFRRYDVLPAIERPIYFMKRLALFLLMSFGWDNTLDYFVGINKLEDHFFSFYAPMVHPWMLIPGVKEAAKFSIETNPRAALRQLAGQLPLGCHAWEKYDPAFWFAECPEEFEGLLP